MDVPDGMKIVITLNKDMSIGVSGPQEVMNNKILTLGMLELAKVAINSMGAQIAEEKRVELAPGPLAPGPRRI